MIPTTYEQDDVLMDLALDYDSVMACPEPCGSVTAFLSKIVTERGAQMCQGIVRVDPFGRKDWIL